MAHPLRSGEIVVSGLTHHRLMEKTAFGRSFCDDARAFRVNGNLWTQCVGSRNKREGFGSIGESVVQ